MSVSTAPRSVASSSFLITLARTHATNSSVASHGTSYTSLISSRGTGSNGRGNGLYAGHWLCRGCLRGRLLEPLTRHFGGSSAVTTGTPGGGRWWAGNADSAAIC